MNLLFPFLLLVTMCAASPQDLSGKMFTFPQQSNTAYVKLITSVQEFREFTVCHRSFTDLKRDHVLFSFSTPTSPNSILIIWDKAQSELEAYVKDNLAQYNGLDDKPNTWHSICTTWSVAEGLLQVWFDGQPLIRKYVKVGAPIMGNSVIIVGQEQDTHGGRFDAKQSFVGMMSDIHMWDYVLSPCQIHKYMNELSFTPGNVLNWGALEYRIFNKVFVEEKQRGCV